MAVVLLIDTDFCQVLHCLALFTPINRLYGYLFMKYPYTVGL